MGNFFLKKNTQCPRYLRDGCPPRGYGFSGTSWNQKIVISVFLSLQGESVATSRLTMATPPCRWLRLQSLTCLQSTFRFSGFYHLAGDLTLMSQNLI